MRLQAHLGAHLSCCTGREVPIPRRVIRVAQGMHTSVSTRNETCVILIQDSPLSKCVSGLVTVYVTLLNTYLPACSASTISSQSVEHSPDVGISDGLAVYPQVHWSSLRQTVFYTLFAKKTGHLPVDWTSTPESVSHLGDLI